MTASINELRADLRLRAVRARTKAAENVVKPAANLADVVSELRAAVQALSELIASQGGKAGPIEFEVTERGLNGKVRSFTVRN